MGNGERLWWWNECSRRQECTLVCFFWGLACSVGSVSTIFCSGWDELLSKGFIYIGCRCEPEGTWQHTPEVQDLGRNSKRARSAASTDQDLQCQANRRPALCSKECRSRFLPHTQSWNVLGRAASGSDKGRVALPLQSVRDSCASGVGSCTPSPPLIPPNRVPPPPCLYQF